MYVVKAKVGAAKENVKRCFRILVLSTPSCNKNVTRPNAAGALWSMIAKNTMNSTSTWCVAAADPEDISFIWIYKIYDATFLLHSWNELLLTLCY